MTEVELQNTQETCYYYDYHITLSSISSDWSQMDTVNYETYETDGVYDSMEQNAPETQVLLFSVSSIN